MSKGRFKRRGRFKKTTQPPIDDRRLQSEWAPQDRYNQIAPDRHRAINEEGDFLQEEFGMEVFMYRYTCDNKKSLDQECRRRGRHYREY